MTVKKCPSYISAKLELRTCPQKGGYGLFAREPIVKDELLSGWAGELYTGEELAQESIERQTHSVQVEENLYLLSYPEDALDLGDYYNHSCDPNAGLDGQICLIAMRDIAVDEEVCFDYAMSDSSDYDEFECHCGSPNCRKRVTGNDWKIPELQQRYRGYFMPYLQHRIDRLNSRK